MHGDEFSKREPDKLADCASRHGVKTHAAALKHFDSDVDQGLVRGRMKGTLDLHLPQGSMSYCADVGQVALCQGQS